jgi:hypothetical protein
MIPTTANQKKAYNKGVMDEKQRIATILRENKECAYCKIMMDTLRKIEREEGQK